MVASVDEPNWQGTAERDLVISKAVPTIDWNPPASIVTGMKLSAMQLNAIADTPGTFVYDPPAGTALEEGEHVLKVEFTPDDAVNWVTTPVTTDEVELRVFTGTAMWLTATPDSGEASITLAFGETETAALEEDAFDVAASPGQEASLCSLPLSASGIRHLSHDFRPFTDENGITRWRLDSLRRTAGWECATEQTEMQQKN